MLSNNKNKNTGKGQHGSVMEATKGDLAMHVASTGVDPTGLGR